MSSTDTAGDNTDAAAMHSVAHALPYLDKALPGIWKAAAAFAAAVSAETAQHGLTPAEAELIKVRASQINRCVFCLDLHSREARKLGVPQQKLDLLPVWRETTVFSGREAALLAIAETATEVPLTENSQADLLAARNVLGDETFVSAEWMAASINLFNRVSILSDHPVRPRDADGNIS